MGGAIISLLADAQYFKLRMADYVQHWRTKWFYVKDQKSSEEQQYGLTLFDPKKELKKLKTWDQIPSEAELAETEPLMTWVMKLKSTVNKEMNGV
jgi:hypothetical protein